MKQAIAIHGAPRSGTTWIGSIFDSSPHVIYRHQPLFAYALKSYLDERASKERIREFFKLLENTDDDFMLRKKEKSVGSIPSFLKQDITHVVYKEGRYHNIVTNLLAKDDKIKVVGIVRNPKSVISSWHLVPSEFKKDEWDLQKEWRKAELKNEGRPENFFGYEKWKEVANLFLGLQKTYPKRFYLLRYADLLNDTRNEVQRIFAFCGLEYTMQTEDFLVECQEKDMSKDAYSVYRKGQSDDKWKQDLPPGIAAEIDQDLADTNLEQFNR